MKIILLKAVSKIGRRGDTKSVSDGYARNFLFPKDFAVIATPENIKKISRELGSKKAQKEKLHESFHNLKIALAGRGIVIKKKARPSDGEADEGKFYAAVSGAEVLEALKLLDFPLPENLSDEVVKFDEPIKTPGKHKAKIVLSGEEINLQILCEPSA